MYSNFENFEKYLDLATDSERLRFVYIFNRYTIYLEIYLLSICVCL